MDEHIWLLICMQKILKQNKKIQPDIDNNIITSFRQFNQIIVTKLWHVIFLNPSKSKAWHQLWTIFNVLLGSIDKLCISSY